MLPPMLPVSVVPVTSQLDPARQKPDIPPVVPVQAGSNESTIDLKKAMPSNRPFCCAKSSGASRSNTSVGAKLTTTRSSICRFPATCSTLITPCPWRR